MPNTIAKIAEGLAAWLKFEKRCGREPLFGESYVAYPLGQLLQYRYPGRIFAELKHPVLTSTKMGRGRKPRIDFGIMGDAGILDLAIETKWASQSPTLLRDIVRDVVRLDLMVPTYARRGMVVLAGKTRNLNHSSKARGSQAPPNSLP